VTSNVKTAITVITITTETTTNLDFSIEIHKIETISSHRSESMLPIKLTSIYMNEEGSIMTKPSSIFVYNEILHSGSHPKAFI